MLRVRHHTPSKIPFWLWPNLLGLDSPLVAVSWQWLFARTFGISLPAIFHLILGLSVWCIYLADRLWDALRAKNTALVTDRLRFTKQNFWALAITMMLVGSANFYLILRFVPLRLMYSGLFTAALLGTYYLFRLFGRGRLTVIIPREILCGMIFAIGSVISVDFFEGPAVVGVGFILPCIFLGLLCSAACILISVWEKDADLAANDSSIATLRPQLLRFLPHAISILVLLAVACAFFASWQIYLAVAIAAMALRIALYYEAGLSITMLRFLADAVLLSPLLVICFT